MTARPGNWSLISDSGTDPVPGDPDAVWREANHYATMADTILEEANRLKNLGQDGTLIGKYKEGLEKKIGDLSSDVLKAHGRYEAVGAALKPFYYALDDARSESWGALQDAETAHADQTSANNMPNPQADPGKQLTDTQKTQVSSRTTAIQNANEALGRAKTRLQNALNDLNDAGKKAAGEINDGSNDSLKDHHSWWDVIVKALKVIVEILNYAVIVLAIAAIFIPGLGEAILLISAAILLIDTGLAATGNGSWMDVALDLVGLATCGVGNVAGKGAKVVVKSGEKAAVKVLMKESGKDMGVIGKFLSRGSRSTKALADVESLGKDALANMGKFDGLATADREMAGELAKIQNLASTFQDSTKIANRLSIVQSLAKTTKIAGYTGLTTVVGNTALSNSNIPGLENVKPYVHGYVDIKDLASIEDMPTKAYDFKWTDLHYDLGSLLETSGPRAN